MGGTGVCVVVQQDDDPLASSHRFASYACRAMCGNAHARERPEARPPLVRGIALPPEGDTVGMDAVGTRSGSPERAEHRPQTARRKGSNVISAWRTQHALAENACPACQGSAYVPAAVYAASMVAECSACKGTGKHVTKKAA